MDFKHIFRIDCINFIDANKISMHMAEASMAAYGAAIGVAIAMAVVCFALRGKGHPEPLD